MKRSDMKTTKIARISTLAREQQRKIKEIIQCRKFTQRHAGGRIDA